MLFCLCFAPGFSFSALAGHEFIIMLLRWLWVWYFHLTEKSIPVLMFHILDRSALEKVVMIWCIFLSNHGVTISVILQHLTPFSSQAFLLVSHAHSLLLSRCQFSHTNRMRQQRPCRQIKRQGADGSTVLRYCSCPVLLFFIIYTFHFTISHSEDPPSAPSS